MHIHSHLQAHTNTHSLERELIEYDGSFVTGDSGIWSGGFWVSFRLFLGLPRTRMNFTYKRNIFIQSTEGNTEEVGATGEKEKFVGFHWRLK